MFLRRHRGNKSGEPHIGSVFSSSVHEILLMSMWERILGILEIIEHPLKQSFFLLVVPHSESNMLCYAWSYVS